jgi:hypothetical protein
VSFVKPPMSDEDERRARPALVPVVPTVIWDDQGHCWIPWPPGTNEILWPAGWADSSDESGDEASEQTTVFGPHVWCG